MHNLIEPVIIIVLLIWLGMSYATRGHLKAELLKCKMESRQKTVMLRDAVEVKTVLEEIAEIQRTLPRVAH